MFENGPNIPRKYQEIIYFVTRQMPANNPFYDSWNKTKIKKICPSPPAQKPKPASFWS